MNRVLSVGLVCTALGVAGYVTGVAVAYPGRSLSVTAAMTGLALVIVGRAVADAEVDRP